MSSALFAGHSFIAVAANPSILGPTFEESFEMRYGFISQLLLILVLGMTEPAHAGSAL